MSKQYTLYGWQLSYFTGKVRSYLKFKKVPFVEKSINLYTMTVKIKKKTGASVMPVLRTPKGAWIQDTSEIIDALEKSHRETSIIPRGPARRFAAYLFEAWVDEWWVPVAMHTRWSYPENYALFKAEAGKNLLPYFPWFIQNMAASKVAKKLRRMLHSVGVRAEQTELLEQWTLTMLDHLEAHFSEHSYIFGDRASLADFALMGPMYGHLGRDPWPAREWIAPRPNLRAWIERMSEPESMPAEKPSEPIDDTIPESLTPIFEAILAEFIPMVQAINEKVIEAAKDIKPRRTLPRALGEISFPMGQGTFKRNALPFTLWMAQRSLNVYYAMSEKNQIMVCSWLIHVGGIKFLDFKIPKLKRVNVKVELSKD